MAFEFTDANFKETAIDNNGVAVIDFWAEWCGPCRSLSPIIDELAEKYEGQATIGKVNVDHNPDVSVKYRVSALPTIIILKDGEEVGRLLGSTSKSTLTKKIEEAIAA